MSIIYINDNEILVKNNNSIEKKDDFHFDKNDIITSSINLKDIINLTFKLPKTTPQEQLKTEAELYFYENSGIDLNKQYKTFFIIKELEQEEIYIIEAIAIAEETLHSKFSKILEHSKWIDFISFEALAFKEFYSTYQKEPKRDAFVYLDEEQSFIVVYENGEYVYYKTLNPLGPLLKILDMSYEQFIDTIATKGLNKESYEMDEFLIVGEIERFFSEYFTAINNRISYGKTIFYLDNIDNIYFYTPFHIEGLDSLKNFWELSGINFEIIPIEKINLLEKLNLIYNEKHYEDEINFSIFPRPPKFYKTKTFQLTSVILLTAAIFGGDYGYRYYQNQQLSQQITKIDKQIKIKQRKLTKLSLINKAILDEYNFYIKEIDNINKQIIVIKNILEKSLQITELPKTNKDLILLSKLLQKDKLKTFLISKDNNNTFNVGVYTKFENRKFIGVFMDDLLSHHYKNVKTDKISTISNNYYVSLIRFEK